MCDQRAGLSGDNLVSCDHGFEQEQRRNCGAYLTYSAGSCFRCGGIAGATQAGLGLVGSVAFHAVIAVVMRLTISGCCLRKSFDSLRSVARS